MADVTVLASEHGSEPAGGAADPLGRQAVDTTGFDGQPPPPPAEAPFIGGDLLHP